MVTAESADGKWTFKSFIHPKITIREVGSETDMFAADLGWGGEATLILSEVTTQYILYRIFLFEFTFCIFPNSLLV